MRLVIGVVVFALRAGKRCGMNRIFDAPDIHPMECSCSACEPYAPGVRQHLPKQIKARLAIAAAIVGTAIAFLIDPVGAAEALRSTVIP